MPSVSEHVNISFDWDDVITKWIGDRQITQIAEALVAAGHGAAAIKAIDAESEERVVEQNAVKVSGTSGAEADLYVDFDHLVNDYARGFPVEHQLRRLAQVHLNRIIAPARSIP